MRFLFLLFTLFYTFGFALLGQQWTDNSVPASTDLYDFTWGKNQMGMLIPGQSEIVEETDSLVHLQGPRYELFISVEDRSMVSEESCVEYLFEQIHELNATLSDEPYFQLKERSVGGYLLAHFEDEDFGDVSLAQACYIDRLSRRIFTVQFVCGHDYDEVLRRISGSLYIMPEPYQY